MHRRATPRRRTLAAGGYYLAHPTIPRDVLTSGIRRMQTEAKETMKLVRDVTGLSYSLDLFADEVDIFGEFDN